MTQILVSIWPSTNTEEKLTKLYEEWVRILRCNLAHYTLQTLKKDVDVIRGLESKLEWKFSLLLDTKWPEIRTWILEKSITYEAWEIFKIFIDQNKKEEKSLFCDYQFLVEDVKIGWIIKIDGGLFDVEVLEKGTDYLVVKAWNNFTVWSKRHINLPGVHSRLPGLTAKDKENIAFAIKEWFNYIALSFARTGKDMDELRALLGENSSQIKIIAKIENQEWIDNIDEIIDASDMIMVARGDLWTELPVEMIPLHQMNIVRKCKIKNIPVIVATQMLESMITNPIPTRAEVSDIFYAVIEGADYVMLSGETTVGKYPIECVEIMKKVIEQAEKF